MLTAAKDKESHFCTNSAHTVQQPTLTTKLRNMMLEQSRQKDGITFPLTDNKGNTDSVLSPDLT